MKLSQKEIHDWPRVDLGKLYRYGIAYGKVLKGASPVHSDCLIIAIPLSSAKEILEKLKLKEK